ncbi:MAG: hypothetical protein HY391_05115 [Deltaproteobacteria bacterium]|nr:hypothetical protein [Deltaproteobacteria bacterium]
MKKSAIFAMKLAELQLLQEVGFPSPIFLVDDVMSELDQARRKNFSQLCGSLGAQLFVSTPEPERTPLRFRECRIFSVKEGEIKG